MLQKGANKGITLDTRGYRCFGFVNEEIEAFIFFQQISMGYWRNFLATPATIII